MIALEPTAFGCFVGLILAVVALSGVIMSLQARIRYLEEVVRAAEQVIDAYRRAP